MTVSTLPPDQVIGFRRDAPRSDAGQGATGDPVIVDRLVGSSDATAFEPGAAAIPADLLSRAQWVPWREEERDGRLTKVPYNPVTGSRASTIDPATWGTYQQAIAFRAERGADGAGFVFSAADALAGIDLDHCRDPRTGAIESWAREIVARLDSYTEISPSGEGLHIFLRGEVPGGKGRKRRIAGKHPDAAVEMYDRGRYFTVTGLHLDGTPTTVEERPAELLQLHARIFGQPSVAPVAPHRDDPPSQISDLDDDALVAKAKAAKNGARFRALWASDTSGRGGDDSAADLALCAHLAFWTGRDAARMDRLFRRTGLYRPKWDERRGDRTYGQLTIEKAIAGCTETYRPSTHPGVILHPVANVDGAVATDDTKVVPIEQPALGPTLGFPLTDLGNAERLVARFGAELRYCHAWDRWLGWDGTRWRVDGTGRIYRLAKETVRGIYTEAAATLDDATRKAIAAWARRSEAKDRLKAMVELARSEPGIPVEPGDLDADLWLLNVANGTLDLRSGLLRPHRPEDLLTKLAPVVYDPEALAPLWEAFLKRVLPDPDLRAFLQRGVGYSLTGDVSEQVLFFLLGGGANGKSTLIDALRAALGDYASQAAPDLLTLSRSERHPTEVADLLGARLVASVEVEDGRRLAEVLVKQLTGGDRLKARYMRQDFFEFEATFKIWLSANHKPTIRGTDHAIWRRIRLIPFAVTIPPQERDPKLPRKLRQELPGILAWAVRGCLAWQREGLGEPHAVAAATEGYRAEMDLLGQFLAERCLVADHAEVASADLFAAYTAWCEQAGERPLPKNRFGARLAERGFEPARLGHSQIRGWRGLGLLAQTQQTDADTPRGVGP